VIATSVYLTYQRTLLQKQLTQQQSLLQAHTETLSNLQLALSQRQPDAQLQQQLALLQQSNARKQQLLNYLQQEMTTKTQGYATVMEGLAKLDPKGLWLTEFSIGADQNLLQGVTSNPALVPLWLQSLGQIPALQGQQFSEIELTPSERKPYLLFSVTKQLQGAKP
jgi:Tfp pilus assembly protein PilN